MQIVDPILASYGVENSVFAVIQLAQTTMGSELGKITLDKTVEERDTRNENIERSINEATFDWGLRYERIFLLHLERRRLWKYKLKQRGKKRAQILESEGERQSHINIADGKRSSVILAAKGIALDSQGLFILLMTSNYFRYVGSCLHFQSCVRYMAVSRFCKLFQFIVKTIMPVSLSRLFHDPEISITTDCTSFSPRHTGLMMLQNNVGKQHSNIMIPIFISYWKHAMMKVQMLDRLLFMELLYVLSLVVQCFNLLLESFIEALPD